MTDSLERATRALRDVSGDDDAAAAATRLRLRRSLDRDARTHRKVTSIGIIFGLAFGGTAWAVATGRAQHAWATLVGDREPVVGHDEEAPAPAPAPALAPHLAHAPTSTPAPMPTPALATAPVAPHAPTPTHARATGPVASPAPTPAVHAQRDTSPEIAAAPVAAAPTEIEQLYRTAHELHFHGTDPTATLAAWDAYLAAEPNGRFSVEARYNRALVLVRLKRYSDARAALAPFAHGDVQPAGYRQHEAQQLLDRLAAVNGSP